MFYVKLYVHSLVYKLKWSYRKLRNVFFCEKLSVTELTECQNTISMNIFLQVYESSGVGGYSVHKICI